MPSADLGKVIDQLGFDWESTIAFVAIRKQLIASYIENASF
jgi:hypothetical protein